MVARAQDILANAIESDARLDGSPTVRDALLHYPSFRRLMLAAAVRSLGAQKLMYDRDSKKVITIEDSATQLKAAAFLAAYTEGLPAQTNVTLNIGDQKRVADVEGFTLEAALRASPALAERLRGVLDTVNSSAKGGKTLKAAEKVSGE